MSLRILAAGDHFVLPSIMVDQLNDELGDEAEYRTCVLPWPFEPFGEVGDVYEASGTEDQILEHLDGVEICVTQMAPLSARVINEAPNLRMIGVTRGGPVNVSLEAATERGVAVCNAPGRNGTAAAEYTIALMLALSRHVPKADASMRAGEWRGDFYAYDECGPELGESVVGVIGYGEIGRRVAQLLGAFGATILVHDPYVNEGALDGGATFVGLPELLNRSDIVTLHARATPGTRPLIGADELAAMPRHALLVNSARGQLVDTEAVCDALEMGHLAGAAFDVFETEPPPPDHRLRQLDNVVLSPHLAGASRATATKGARIVAEEVARFVRGEALRHRINRMGDEQ